MKPFYCSKHYEKIEMTRSEAIYSKTAMCRLTCPNCGHWVELDINGFIAVMDEDLEPLDDEDYPHILPDDFVSDYDEDDYE